MRAKGRKLRHRKVTCKESVICLVLLLAVNAFGLENPSFEAKDPLHGWRAVVIKEGQDPLILADRSKRKEGEQSLLIAAKNSADIAIVQKVNLPPDSLWRITCWIQTEELQTEDSTVIGGTLHIRTMDNFPVIEAPGQFGTSSWRKVEALFRVPSSGEAQIVLFFIGFGKGTGKVWFDDIRLEKIADAPTQVPVTGPKRLKVELLDEVMLKYLDKIGCTAATLAISKGNRTLYKRGYGWRDRARTIPTEPDTMIGIASCGKPIVAAAIRRLARQKKIDLDAKLFDVLPIKPQGAIVDERVKNITINHLLEHKAGWGNEPRDLVIKAVHKAGFKDPISTETFLSFVMTRLLEDEPGTKSKYSNFGYDVLVDILEKKSRSTSVEYFCIELLGLSAVKGMHQLGQPFQKNALPVIWNNEGGGLFSASAKTLCRFMQLYWLTGEQRREGNPYWVFYGSLPSSTAMMVWRSDGINLVALFNGRTSSVGCDEIKSELERVINKIQGNIVENIDFKNNWKEFGTLYCSKTFGDTAEYIFEGRSISWIGRRYDDAGKAKVEIDDKEVAIVDQYGPVRDKPFHWDYKRLGPGQHKIVITVLGEKNPKSKDNWINIEKFLSE